MPALRNFAIRWYRNVFGAPAGSDIRNEGLHTVLDGNNAVALSEAGIASHAVLGGAMPSSTADSVWLGEHGHTNLYGEALSAQTAEGPRGIIAATTGLALAGRRATAFLSGPDIAAAQDLLISAAGKHAPFVLHVGTRAAPAHGAVFGSGHDSIHLSSDSGFFMLFATNVQQAVDFTYIARQVSEETLVPGMVIMDGEQTALAVQNVRLLSPAQVGSFLGSARQQIEPPTAAQKLLFGESRRRIPAWHDLDEPVLMGALFERQNFALGAFARKPYFDTFVGESLEKSYGQFAQATGRHHASISRHQLDGATVVLLAQGAAVETARVAAKVLRARHKRRVGVIGVQALRPFPGEEIAAALESREQVFVLDRVNAPMSAEPPLIREVRASLNRLGSSQPPTCRAVVYGVGGLPLRVADLIELCSTSRASATTPLYLGLKFDDTSGEQPKREVLLDALRRAYPDVADMGIRAAEDASESAQDNALTLAIHRIDGGGGDELLGATGMLLHNVLGGRIRSRPSVSWEQWSAARVDWITHGNEELQDPGDALPADVSVNAESGEFLLRKVSSVFRVPLENGDKGLKGESLLGGLFGVLTRSGLIEVKARRVIAARQSLLKDVDEIRREQLLGAFRSGLGEVVEVDTAEADISSADAANRWDGEVPAAVRHLGRNDDHYASLPRFWDQLGVLYRDGMSERLTAGPYLATGTLPPLSSTFSDLSDKRRMLPRFDPTHCTGCGLCWTRCPDSAIGVGALTPAALIDAGINLTGAEAVRQVSNKLALRIIASNKTADIAAPTFGQMLDESFSWLEGKLPEERKQTIRDGLEKVSSEIGTLPVAVTNPFFHEPEAQRKESAELLALVINPDACKDCGICIDSCEPGALQPCEQDTSVLRRARDLWATWAKTPDTSSETLERVAGSSGVGVMAAILLSRYCQFALAGGDLAEAGSGEKIAVRLFLSATEFHQQPLVQRFAETLQEAGEAVSSLVKETISGTLAVEDLDTIAEQVKRAATPRVDLKTLVERTTGSGDHSIDTDYLLRLIDLSDRITAAHHRLVQGEHGLGRARYGLAVAGGSTAAWAGAFPHNPFQAPVLIDMSGDAAQFAAGLIEGHLDETTELVRLLRLARLEVEQADGSDWKRKALASLRWQDLGGEEFGLCPPLVLVGSDEMLAGRGLSQLIWLLNSGLPVKVLVLHALDFGLAKAGANNPRASLGLVALAQRNAFVAQSSVADAAHLADSILQALRYDGPALLQVYAPSPSRHGFASEQTLAQAELAVTSRAMPLYRYDPTVNGVFGTRISLDGNPQLDETTVEVGEKHLTPADWAMRQQRFAKSFRPLADDASIPTPLHEWLELDTKSRSRKTPYVVDASDQRRYSMTPTMIDMTEQCLETWQTLQELAGVATPFTERLEQEIRAELAAEHQAELDALQEASNERIQAIQAQTETEIANKIRSRLLQLAARKRE